MGENKDREKLHQMLREAFKKYMDAGEITQAALERRESMKGIAELLNVEGKMAERYEIISEIIEELEKDKGEPKEMWLVIPDDGKEMKQGFWTQEKAEEYAEEFYGEGNYRIEPVPTGMGY